MSDFLLFIFEKIENDIMNGDIEKNLKKYGYNLKELKKEYLKTEILKNDI